MKRKRFVFLTLNYIQIGLCLFLIGWFFGYKRTPLLDKDYIGLIVFSMFLIFILNSLMNVFSSKTPVNLAGANKLITIVTSILTTLSVLSAVFLLLICIAGIYTFFIAKSYRPKFNVGVIVALVLSLISLVVLANQLYYKRQFRKYYNKQLEREIDAIGAEPSTHE